MTPFEGNRTLMYHATFGCYKDSILKYGLNPAIGRTHKNWEFSEDNLVCLAFDGDVAEDFCESNDTVPDEVYDSGIVLFEVDISGLELFYDPNVNEINEDGSLYDIALVYEGVISPDRLEIIDEYKIKNYF